MANILPGGESAYIMNDVSNGAFCFGEQSESRKGITNQGLLGELLQRLSRLELGFFPHKFMSPILY